MRGSGPFTITAGLPATYDVPAEQSNVSNIQQQYILGIAIDNNSIYQLNVSVGGQNYTVPPLTHKPILVGNASIQSITITPVQLSGFVSPYATISISWYFSPADAQPWSEESIYGLTAGVTSGQTVLGTTTGSPRTYTLPINTRSVWAILAPSGLKNATSYIAFGVYGGTTDTYYRLRSMGGSDIDDVPTAFVAAVEQGIEASVTVLTGGVPATIVADTEPPPQEQPWWTSEQVAATTIGSQQFTLVGTLVGIKGFWGAGTTQANITIAVGNDNHFWQGFIGGAAAGQFLDHVRSKLVYGNANNVTVTLDANAGAPSGLLLIAEGVW